MCVKCTLMVIISDRKPVSSQYNISTPELNTFATQSELKNFPNLSVPPFIHQTWDDYLRFTDLCVLQKHGNT